MTTISDTRSEFLVAEGELRLIITAPDDPGAPLFGEQGEKCWSIKACFPEYQYFIETKLDRHRPPLYIWRCAIDVLTTLLPPERFDLEISRIGVIADEAYKNYRDRKGAAKTLLAVG